MSSGKRIELKGKSIRAISDYFESSDTYLLEDCCQYDEKYDEAIKPLAWALKDYMSELTVYQYIYASVILAEEEIRKVLESGGDIDDSEARKSIVKFIVDDLSGFPRNYEWRIELPRFNRLPACQIPITEGIFLDYKSGEFPELVLKVSGYCGWDFNQPTMVETTSLIKNFIFILEWLGLVWHTQGYETIEAKIVDHYLENNRQQVLKPDLSQLIAGSRLSVSHIVKRNGAPANLNAVEVLTSQMAPVGDLIALLRQDEHAAIATAIEWYMDSRFVENQTVAMLEICIGLEAILGGEEEIKDMTNRLCDRLGFLLGKTREQRRAFSEQYRAVLSLRGKLVHGKQAKLDKAGSQTLSVARHLLKRVIEHELGQLKN